MLSFIFTQCSQEKQEEKKTLSEQNNTDQIIFLYEYYKNYLKETENNKETDDYELYRKNVYYPIFNSYFENTEYYTLVADFISQPIQNKDELKNNLERIADNKNIISELIQKSLAKSKDLLKVEKLQIFVAPANPDDKNIIYKMGGVMGLTAGKEKILIFIEPDVPEWQTMLELAVAHEYFHAYWTEKNFYSMNKFTLLDYLLFEGRADAFAHIIYPEVHTPWTTALSDEDKTELWNTIKSNLSTEDYKLQQAIMFGYGGYPLWGGYSLGFDIMQKYLSKNPDVKLEEWASIDPKLILQASDYN